MCPLVKIEILKGKSDKHKKAILEGVHDALVQAIKIPDYEDFKGYMSLIKPTLSTQKPKQTMLP